jgi:hypothetical protein
MAEAQAKSKPGPYDLCPCGSGKKVKFCECRFRDAAGAKAVATDETGPPPADHHRRRLCQYYRAGRRSISALNRRDFKWLTSRMAAEGRSILHIDDQRNLGSRPEHLRAALDHLERLGIRPNFRSDPSVEELEFAQHVVDLLCTEGVYRVKGSGELWGRSGRNSWRIDRDGVPTAFCGQHQPIGFVLLGARCQDLKAEGYELPIPLLRVVAAASLFAEMAQMAEQIQGLAAQDLPAGADGVLLSAPDLFTELALTDTTLPTYPDGDTSLSPAGLLACALAFDGSLAAPEAAVASYSLTNSARAQYVGALRRAADCASAVEIFGLLPEVEHPPGRTSALQLLEALRLRGHALAREAADPEEALILGINAIPVRDFPDYQIGAPTSPQESNSGLDEALPSVGAEAGSGVATEAVASDLTVELDELVSTQRGSEPFATITAPVPAFEADRLEAQRALEAARLATVEIANDVGQLRRQLDQVKSDLAEAEHLERLRTASWGEAERRLRTVEAEQDAAEIAALGSAMTAALEILQLAAEIEKRTGFEIHQLLNTPEAARLQQVISDYEGMRRDGILPTLPETALQAIQRAVGEAKQSLASITPAAATRRSLHVPMAVSADIRADAGADARLHVGLLAPIPADELTGPLARLVVRLARGVKELIEYLDIDPATVRITRHDSLGGGMLLGLDAPAPGNASAEAAAEAAAVMLESAVADDENAPLPMLLVPQLGEVPARLLSTVHLAAAPVTLQLLDEADGDGPVDLDAAAAQVGCSPLELAIHLALGGMLLEDDGEVDRGALRTLIASSGRLAQAPPRPASVPTAVEHDLNEIVRRDTNLRRRAARSVLLRLVREERWAPSATEVRDAVQLLPRNLHGEGRQAVGQLEKAGWLAVRSRPSGGSRSVGLVGEARKQITTFIETGDGAPSDLAGWLREGG